MRIVIDFFGLTKEMEWEEGKHLPDTVAWDLIPRMPIPPPWEFEKILAMRFSRLTFRHDGVHEGMPRFVYYKGLKDLDEKKENVK